MSRDDSVASSGNPAPGFCCGVRAPPGVSHDLVNPYLIGRIKALNDDHCRSSRWTVSESPIDPDVSSLLKACFGIAIRFAGLERRSMFF